MSGPEARSEFVDRMASNDKSTEPLFRRVHGTIARMVREGNVRRPKPVR